jgi:hypothetical protein
MPLTVLCLSMLATPFAPAEPWPAVWEVWDAAVTDKPVGRVWIEQVVVGERRSCVERWALASSRKSPASLQDRKLELKPTVDERPADLAAFVTRAALRLDADLARFDRTVTAIEDGACDAVPLDAPCTWASPPERVARPGPQTWAPGTTRVRYGEQVYGFLWKTVEGDAAVERWVFDDPSGLARARMEHTWMATGSASGAAGFRTCACQELADNNVPGVARAYEVREVAVP